MHPHPKGGYHIVQKQKSLYKVRAPTWAPLIEEKEIIYTKWFLVDVRMGHWKGREVGRPCIIYCRSLYVYACTLDVILGYEDYYLKRVEDTVMGYLALKGLDITYAVVAHVIHTDGSIIGVATEPEVGRLVQFRDRTLVYDAISRLQQRHLIYNGIHYSKIHILHGKVRLSNLASIRYIKDPVELKEEAERRHWRALEQLFNSLDPADEVPQLALERTFKQTTLKLLPEHPSPERPRLVRFLLTTYLPQGIDGRSRFPSGERANGRARKHSVVSPSVELLGFAEMLEVDAADVQDLPFSVQKTSVGIARLTAPKCQAIGCHKTHAFTVSNSCMP